jgi:hypothetical protein
MGIALPKFRQKPRKIVPLIVQNKDCHFSSQVNSSCPAMANPNRLEGHIFEKSPF